MDKRLKRLENNWDYLRGNLPMNWAFPKKQCGLGNRVEVNLMRNIRNG